MIPVVFVEKTCLQCHEKSHKYKITDNIEGNTLLSALCCINDYHSLSCNSINMFNYNSKLNNRLLVLYLQVSQPGSCQESSGTTDLTSVLCICSIAQSNYFNHPNHWMGCTRLLLHSKLVLLLLVHLFLQHLA